MVPFLDFKRIHSCIIFYPFHVTNLWFEQAVLQIILGHVAAMGWENCCWSDDNLSSKKLFPKFQFPSKTKKWLARMKTSDSSMELAVLYCQNKFLDKSVDFRRKPDVDSVENVSLKAAVAVNIQEELLKLVPLDSARLSQEWLHAWAKGDAKVDVELESMILDKSESLDVRQIPTLKRLLDEHVFTRPIAQTQRKQESLTMDEFNLFVKQMEYDIQVFQTWEKKTVVAEASREHAVFKWKRDSRQQSVSAAELFLQSCARLLVWDKKAEKNIAEVMNFKRTIMGKMGIDHVGQIPQVIYMNATAPCLVTSSSSSNAVEILTWALADNMQSVGIVMAPVFTYQRGRLILEEKTLLDALFRGNHNIDWCFAALFSEKTDSRDQRPMCYNGRFVFASPLELQKNVFWKCDLRRTQRTAEIPQLHSREMREVENLDPDSVPDSSDPSVRVKGATKYAQLGHLACKEIFDAVLRGANHTEIGPALLLLDLHVGVGDMLQAFTTLRADRPHTFYLGFCEDMNEALYVEQLVKELLADQFAAGQPLPTGEKLAQEMPADLLETLPEIPRLNVLVPGWIALVAVFF